MLTGIRGLCCGYECGGGSPEFGDGVATIARIAFCLYMEAPVGHDEIGKNQRYTIGKKFESSNSN